MSNEPTAHILFNNMLKYSLNYTPSFRKAGILAPKGSSLYKNLLKFGADIKRIKNFPPSDLSSYNILFIDSAGGKTARLILTVRYCNDLTGMCQLTAYLYSV